MCDLLLGWKLRRCSPTGAGVAGLGEGVIASLLCRGQKWEVKLNLENDPPS